MVERRGVREEKHGFVHASFFVAGKGYLGEMTAILKVSLLVL